jgi:streptogramin lyase
MKRKSRLLLSLTVLTVLLASAAIAFTATLQTTHAASASALTAPVAVDFSINGGSDPWGTAFDSSGNVWVAVPQCDPSPTCASGTPPGKIDVYNPNTKSWQSSIQLPSGFGQALFLAFDKQGRVWFPMPMTSSLGMYNPSTKTFSQWTVPTLGSGPWDVAVDSLGTVWFTEHFGNKIGSFNPTTHVFHEIATPATNSVPYGIVVDSSNNVWFTENSDAVALIGEYTNAGVLKEYKVRNGSTTGLTPHLITVDSSGNIWWSEGWVGEIGKLNVSLAAPNTNNGVTEFTYPRICANCGTHTSGISADSRGLVWFDDSIQSIFGYFSTSGVGTPSVFNSPSSNSHPHDGIHVGPNNVVWFTEEFANKLGNITYGGTVPTPVPTTPVTVTPSPTPSPVATTTPGQSLGQDTFQRANQSLWGKASDGQTWGGDSNVTTGFSISNHTGIATNIGSSSAVLGLTSANASVLFSGSINNFSGNNFGAVARWTDGNNWYKAYIDGANLVIQKKVNGTATIIATVPFVASAGKSYSLRFNVTGTTLSARVWVTGTTEPTTWKATATDTSLTSGQAGLRILSQSAITTITSFSATTI